MSMGVSLKSMAAFASNGNSLPLLSKTESRLGFLFIANILLALGGICLLELTFGC